MFRISCFADEISPDLDEQIAVLNRNNVKYVELRGVWGKNVLDLSDNEIDIVSSRFFENGINISSIGSPIGKVNINDDFDKHMIKFERAIQIAKKMKTNYIRIFSFYMEKDKLDFYEDEVISRLRSMVKIAADNNLVLLHENEAGIYGETSTRCLNLMEKVGGTSFGAVFDPSNFVVAGENVIKESFPKIKDYIEYIHVKDSIKSTGEIVIAGLGDGNIVEVLDKLREKDNMFLSLEPHLMHAGKSKGFTGAELFEKDLKALREILDNLEIEYI